MTFRLESPHVAFRIGALLLLLAAVPAAHAGPRGLRRPHPASRGEARTVGDGIGRPDPAFCRPRKDTLAYHGGDLVESPAVSLLFWGSQWTTDPQHLATKAALIDFYADVGTSGFACAWREYAVLGHPLSAGSFDGSFVLTSAPSNPLSDADIQSEIAHQIGLGHLPPRTDDRVYVVIPEEGVVVDGGGETGCGGNNFTFCGYHGVFGTVATRHRYAVLPFPCNSGGFTCFVGPTDDPTAALQAVGAHELAETVTDPDDDSLGGSGWYSDRTGNENADICADDGCVDQLTVGANTYDVNPTWSNLGRGCISEVPCAVTPACSDGAPGLCVPATSHANRCALELEVDPNLTVKKGLPSAKISCTDGQPFCDFDGAVNGSCTFHLATCLNSQDPRVACANLPIDTIVLGAPKAASTNPIDAANALAILGGLESADAGSTGTVVGATVAYTPAATTSDACTGFVDVEVPIGSRTVSLKAVSGKTKLPAKVTLSCRP